MRARHDEGRHGSWRRDALGTRLVLCRTPHCHRSPYIPLVLPSRHEPAGRLMSRRRVKGDTSSDASSVSFMSPPSAYVFSAPVFDHPVLRTPLLSRRGPSLVSADDAPPSLGQGRCPAGTEGLTQQCEVIFGSGLEESAARTTAQAERPRGILSEASPASEFDPSQRSRSHGQAGSSEP
jgi:hypothetical protein